MIAYKNRSNGCVDGPPSMRQMDGKCDDVVDILARFLFHKKNEAHITCMPHQRRSFKLYTTPARINSG